MNMIVALLAAALLFCVYGLVARHTCDGCEHRCGACPLPPESEHDEQDISP